MSNGTLNKNALITLQRRYFLKNGANQSIEDWEQLCNRVSNAIASDEKTVELKKEWGKKYFDLIYNLYFIPNSPTLMNAGKENGQLAACFVLPIEDSMESIMGTVSNSAFIHKSGGGTGFDFSRLRPAQSRVGTTSGVASGPISFMRMINGVTEEIKQGGTRRGANMGILRVDHPDIISFINCKKDTTQLTNFNISVAITDKFMKAVEKNEDYDIINPKTKEVTKKNAKEVFDLLVKNAHANGEPGVFFVDEANRKNIHGTIRSTNPCVTGDTEIATLNGNIPIKELAKKWAEDKKDILVYTWNKKTKLPEVSIMTRPCQTGHNASIVKITFDSGLELRCTKKHSLFSFRGKKIQVKDLKVGQRVRAFAVSTEDTNHFRMHGWQDGKTKHIWVHRAIWEFYNGEIPEGYEVNHINGDSSNNRIENLEILTNKEHNQLHYKERLKKGFHSIGVNKSKECGKKISESLKKHYETIKNHKIISIEECRNEDVYNATVNNTHAYIIADDKYCGDYKNGVMSGIVSANCGEQPLRDNEACTLGSMNLNKYIDKEHGNIFDYILFTEHVVIATRFLDSVISVNKYPLEIIEKTHKETRKIGLGIMGLADAFIRMGITYGSKISYETAENIYKCLSLNAIKTSELLGEEKGFCYSNECNRRNLNVTTIAPTGSISIIAGCSSGIEPIFAVIFQKNILDGDKLLESNPIFKSMMGNIDNKLKEKIYSSQSIQTIKEVPEHIRKLFVTSHDLTVEQHVKMQAVFQKHCDSGVSKTINMPNNATIKDVEKAFKLAYQLKCKGITVYRDGSRPNQVLSTKKDTLIPRKKFNRTVKLHGSTEEISTPLGTLFLTINETTNGNPIEVIMTIGKSGADITAFAEGLGRIISTGLQHGVPPYKFAKQLKEIQGEDTIFHSGQKYTSILDLVGKRLAEISKEKEEEEREAKLAKCPSCGARLYNAEGCNTCLSCGYSKC